MHTIEFERSPLHRHPIPPHPARSRRSSQTLALGLLAAFSLLCVHPTAHAQEKKDDSAAKPGEDSQPAGASAPESEPAASAESSDLEALRQEYLRLRDELFRSRARAAAVASAMYSTRLVIHLNYNSSRFHTVTRATVRLDGANVYDDASSAIANDTAARFEGFVAPGRHVISIRIETTSKDDERFTSTSEHSFTIQAPAGKNVVITAKAKDDGDIAYAWQKKERGSYQPSLIVTVKTEKRIETTPEASAPKPAGKGEKHASSGGARGR